MGGEEGVNLQQTTSLQHNSNAQIEQESNKTSLDIHYKVFYRLFYVFGCSQLVISLVYFLVHSQPVCWNVYPAIVFCMILGIYYSAKMSIDAPNHTQIFAVVSLGITTITFVTWLNIGGGFPFFIYPFFLLNIVPVICYIVKHYRANSHLGFYIHFSVYGLINIMVFFTWLAIQAKDPNLYPFYVFSFGAWGEFLLLHLSMSYFPNDTLFRHLVLSANLNSMIFLVWRFSGSLFPWFLFPLSVSIVAYFIHRLARKKQANSHVSPFIAQENGEVTLFQNNYFIYPSNAIAALTPSFSVPQPPHLPHATTVIYPNISSDIPIDDKSSKFPLIAKSDNNNNNNNNSNNTPYPVYLVYQSQPPNSTSQVYYTFSTNSQALPR